MPTYRYRCGKCGEEFETWQSIKDDALQTHDRGCGGDLLKVLTPAGIVLKGSGFYKTDSRKSASDDKESDQGSDTKPDKKDDSTSTSSESTPKPSSDGAKTGSSDGAKSSDTKKPAPSPTTP